MYVVQDFLDMKSATLPKLLKVGNQRARKVPTKKKPA